MAVIAMLNQKGGVGKTSTCHHLAGTLAAAGRRVLLVDNDPQASLTQGFLGPGALDADPIGTIAAVYSGEVFDPSQVVATVAPGIDLLGGSTAAGDFNVPRPESAPAEQQTALRDFLATMPGYDFVLIDCPPNLHLCSWAALVAAEWLMVPLQAEDYGAQGIAAVQRSMRRVGRLNGRLRLLGYLLTMFNPRLAIHSSYAAILRETYGSEVFAATVPIATDFKEAIAARQTIASYKPRGAAAKAIKAVAVEISDRITAASQSESEAA